MDKNIIPKDSVDAMEVFLQNLPPVECPLMHKFVPGMYIRKVLMKKGSWITSLRHNTEHPFFVMTGRAIVYNTQNKAVDVIQSPYDGITYPGTHRLLYIEEDCVWVTCHPTDIQPENDSEEAVLIAVGKVAEQILDIRDNPFLNGRYINNIFVPNQSLVTD